MKMSVDFNLLPVTLCDLSAILSLNCFSTTPQNSCHVYFILTITYTFGSATGGFLVGSNLLVSPFFVELNDVLFTANTPSLPFSISPLITFPASPFEMPSGSGPLTPSTNLDSVIRLPHSSFVIVNSHSSFSNALIPQICFFR